VLSVGYSHVEKRDKREKKPAMVKLRGCLAWLLLRGFFGGARVILEEPQFVAFLKTALAPLFFAEKRPL
jgi:hypothetical protein